jgi:hypothetical protein
MSHLNMPVVFFYEDDIFPFLLLTCFSTTVMHAEKADGEENETVCGKENLGTLNDGYCFNLEYIFPL